MHTRSKFRIKAYIRSIIACGIACLVSLNVLASPLFSAESFPQNILIVGDSLSDIGNSPPISVTVHFPLDLANNASPITNGVTYTYPLSSLLGVPFIMPSTIGGTNYAYGGAQTITDTVINTQFIPSLLNQVKMISPNHSKHFPLFISGGANDFLQNPFIPGATVAQRLMQVVNEAYAKGFETIIVSNLPDLGRPPVIRLDPVLSALLTEASSEFNQSLNTLLAAQSNHVILANVAAVFDEVINNPEIYHLSDLLPSVNANLAGNAFYYDGFHPAEALHNLLAQYFTSLLRAPLYAGSLAEDSFSLFRQQTVSLQQQLFPLQPLQGCGVTATFISGNYAPLLKHHVNSAGNQSTSGGNITLGVTHGFSDRITLGTAINYTADHDEGAYYNDFSYDLSNLSGSIFGDYSSEKWYVNAFFSGGWLDFSRVKRSFWLGPEKLNTHAKTDGQLYGGLLNSGYYLYHYGDVFYTGPTASVEYQHITVNGYKESGAAIGNLEFQRQRNQSLVVGLGWEFDWNFPQEIPLEIGFVPPVTQYGSTASLSVNHQCLRSKREILFRETSLSSVWGAWPVLLDRSTYISGIANLYTEFSNAMIFNLGYFFNAGSFSMSEHRITAALSFPFGQ